MRIKTIRLSKTKEKFFSYIYIYNVCVRVVVCVCVWCSCLQHDGTLAFLFESSSDSCVCYTEDNEKIHCLAKNDVTDHAGRYFYIIRRLSKPLCESTYL